MQLVCFILFIVWCIKCHRCGRSFRYQLNDLIQYTASVGGQSLNKLRYSRLYLLKTIRELQASNSSQKVLDNKIALKAGETVQIFDEYVKNIIIAAIIFLATPIAWVFDVLIMSMIK